MIIAGSHEYDRMALLKTCICVIAYISDIKLSYKSLFPAVYVPAFTIGSYAARP